MFYGQLAYSDSGIHSQYEIPIIDVTKEYDIECYMYNHGDVAVESFT